MSVSGVSSSSNTTNSNRYAGLSGMDVDSLVKAKMQTLQKKIDTTQQKEDTLKIQQELYRGVINDFGDFYKKYFLSTDSKSMTNRKNYRSITYESSNKAAVIAVAGPTVTTAANFKVHVDSMAKGASKVINLQDLDRGEYLKINYLGKNIEVDISQCTTDEELAAVLNTELKSYGMTASYSQFDKGVNISTTKLGKTAVGSNHIIYDNIFTLKVAKYDYRLGAYKDIKEFADVEKGDNLKASITKIANGVEKTIVYGDNAGAGELSSESNTVTIDDISFSLNSTTKDGDVTLSGSKDVSEIKKRIVNFVNDYNTLVEKTNKLLNEKRDRDYQPLTDEQKENMTEDQIKKWEAKVKEGQLSRDMDISNVLDSLKNAMEDSVPGVGITLGSIGITLVKNYDDKAGTFEIDEDKLEEALKNHTEEIQDLFTKYPENANNMKKEEVNQNSGIAKKMYRILWDTTQSSTVSALVKKAGRDSSSVNDTLSKSIKDYEKQIKQLKKDFKTKQQNLYSKYSRYESMLNKYNNQMSYLSSSMGG